MNSQALFEIVHLEETWGFSMFIPVHEVDSKAGESEFGSVADIHSKDG
jgi:hypothetical protein